MNVSILKRLAALENKLSAGEKPGMVMIFYDQARDGFVIREMYDGAKGKGYHQREIVREHYRGYIFQGDFDCDALVCLIGYEGSEGGLYAFNIAKFRKAAKLNKNEAFSINRIVERTAPDGKRQEAEFEIIVYSPQGGEAGERGGMCDK